MKVLKFVVALSALTVLVSCSDEVPNTTGELSLTARSPLNSTTAQKSTAQQQLSISNFLVNISNVELELDLDQPENDNESWDDNGYLDAEDEVELRGPFTLDLTAGDINFIDVGVPNAMYEEIEFSFSVNTDETNELFNKSILVKGTINDVPFMFWHNFEEEVEVDFENEQTDILIASNSLSLAVNFNLSMLFDGEDLSQISDGNQDGVIEISPTDEDGNTALAQRLKLKLKTLINLLED